MQTESQGGLSETQAKHQLAKFGLNLLTEQKNKSALFTFLTEFKNPLVGILLAAGVLSAFLGDWTSSVIIIAIVVASVLLDFINTHKSQQAAEALKQKVMVTTRVIRSGKIEDIPLSHVAVGDLALVGPGNIIPADGKVLEGNDFFLNESSLTGESFPVEKESGMEVLMGSSCITGSAKIRITKTGQQTKLSGIAQSLTNADAPTEFDRGIKDFSYLIMKVTFVLVVFIFLINAVFRSNLLESFLFAAALAVGLTPELLPMIIALNLSQGSLKMSKHGVIVKKLSAIQNFGGMDVLCTDKTGTLTEDKIALVKYVDSKGKISEPALLYAYINSCYHTGFTNPLDTAIQEFKHLNTHGYKKIDEIPFDYARRRHSIIAQKGKQRVLVTKGAPEEMFSVCAFGGKYGTLAAARNEYETLSREGYRVLAVAVKKITTEKKTYSKADESHLHLVGFMAFLDPAKESAANTLKQLEDYGVEIKIITGDNELVTEKIARDLHLPVKGVITGPQLAAMSEPQMAEFAKHTTIFARVTPDQKKRIIQCLQQHGHVVGYLGDGVNDAPSLKAADVSISVNNAVDVAKEEADLILLRKDLKELTEGVIEGRRTFANTMKYLMVSLSSNFGNMFSMAGASVFITFLPMLPTQILLNNLLYDASNFAIPKDTVEENALKKPRRLKIAFLKKFMVIFGLTSSCFDFLTFGALLYFFHATAGQFQTGWFIESLITQTLVIYIIRTRSTPLFKNWPSRWLIASTLGIIAVGLTIVLTGLGRYFYFIPLKIYALLGIFTIIALYLAAVSTVKLWFYKRYSALI